MKFPTSGGGQPYCRIDGRTGEFTLSVPDGAPEPFAMAGRALDLDVAGAEQGWLHLSPNGADWQPLAARDAWTGTPRPSDEHKPGVDLMLHCPDWPEPKARQLRSASRAVTNFVAQVAEQAGDVPAGKAVRARITGVEKVRIGKGNSVNFAFRVEPQSAWPSRAVFDAEDEHPLDGLREDDPFAA